MSAPRIDAAKARGTKLGGTRGGQPVDHRIGTAFRQRRADARAKDIGPIAVESRRGPNGTERSYAAVAEDLTQRGITTPRGGAWTPAGAQKLIQRYTALSR